MCKEVIDYLNVVDGKVYFDGTFGQGGYSNKILEKSNCNVIASDRDKHAEKFASILKKKYKERFEYKTERFSKLDEIISFFNREKVDGITLDLGISNTQIEEAERGFSFNKNGPLDMRMGSQNQKDLTAEQIVNNYSEKELSEIFYKYGEEKNSFRISRKIVERRKLKKIKTTIELSEIINEIPIQKKNRKINPSTKVFQALRIFINKELEELEDCIEKSIQLLNSKSRLIIVSFHSLEDRIVKKIFRKHSGYSTENYKHLPEKIKQNREKKISLKVLTKKIIRPSFDEIKNNPRARSAKLRAAEKI